jgi:hypothetical protein
MASRKLVSTVISIVIFLLNLVNHDGLAATIPSSSIFYVIASVGDSPATSCYKKYGLPIARSFVYDHPWNYTTLSLISNSLGKNVSLSSSHGLKGCCSPGMWCDTDGCFTQSFGGPFTNYGFLNGNTKSLPVYSCYYPQTSQQNPEVKTVSYKDGSLVVLGKNFNDDEEAMTAALGGEYCDDLQVRVKVNGSLSVRVKVSSRVRVKVNGRVIRI